jgi:hypothetical protein
MYMTFASGLGKPETSSLFLLSIHLFFIWREIDAKKLVGLTFNGSHQFLMCLSLQMKNKWGDNKWREPKLKIIHNTLILI